MQPGGQRLQLRAGLVGGGHKGHTGSFGGAGMAKGGLAKTPLRTTAQEGCIRVGAAPGLGDQRHGPFPSANHLLPMVVVCPASSEAAHHGVLGPPQSRGVFPWGFKVPTGASELGRASSLCPLGSHAPTSWRGQLPTPHTLLCLSPDPSARPKPQASSSQDTCWVLPAARTQAWTQVCGVGSLVSPGEPC